MLIREIDPSKTTKKLAGFKVAKHLSHKKFTICNSQFIINVISFPLQTNWFIPQETTSVSIILGIDPGSNITGYGVIHSEKNKHRYLDCGIIRVKHSNFAAQLQQIYSGISKIVTLYQPDEVAVEQVFVNINVNSALKLGQARGAAIVAASANEQIKFAEYSSRQVKQAVVGYGAATKVQVQHMIKALLQLSEAPSEDAADALAVALCHAQTRRGLTLLEKAQKNI